MQSASLRSCLGNRTASLTMLLLAYRCVGIPAPQQTPTSNTNFDILHIEGNDYIQLNCTGRASEHPFSPTGISVQFIHVPKAAGTTIEHYLLNVARLTQVNSDLSML